MLLHMSSLFSYKSGTFPQWTLGSTKPPFLQPLLNFLVGVQEEPRSTQSSHTGQTEPIGDKDDREQAAEEK